MNLNILKGLLIVLVVVDHNDFSRSIFPRFLDAFSFHVVGFLAIPFLKPAGGWGKPFAAYVFRLYHPFLVVTTLMAIVIAVVTPVAPADQFKAWLLALYSGNSQALKQATGMALLWFLPSFISIVALRTALENSSGAVKALAMALLVAAHPFVGAVAPSIQDYLPMGVLPAIYAIPLAYLVAWVQRRWFDAMPRWPALAVTAAVFVVVKYVQLQAHLLNEVGFAAVADYTDPYGLLVNDLESVTGVLMLFQAARFALPALLDTCGRFSMQIYLFHAFVALFIYKAVVRLPLPGGVEVRFAVSLALTVLVTTALARWLLQRGLVQRLLFPRSPAELALHRGLLPRAPSTTVEADGAK